MKKLATFACALALCTALPAGAIAVEDNETEMTGDFTPVVEPGPADSNADTGDSSSAAPSQEELENWYKEEAAKVSEGSEGDKASDTSNETELSTDGQDGQEGAESKASDDSKADSDASASSDSQGDATTTGATSSTTDSNAKDEKKTTDTSKDKDKATNKKTDDKKATGLPEGNSFLFLLLGCVAVAIAAAAAFLARSKRSDEVPQDDDPWSEGYETDEWSTMDNTADRTSRIDRPRDNRME